MRELPRGAVVLHYYDLINFNYKSSSSLSRLFYLSHRGVGISVILLVSKKRKGWALPCSFLHPLSSSPPPAATSSIDTKLGL